MLPAQYRFEVDGLRAIAVISVVLYHADFEAFEGGYIGVDVFFTISGYLICRLICADIINHSFGLRKFYASRMTRLLPYPPL